MKVVKNIFLILFMMLMFITIFPVNAYADSACVSEAKAYYQAYGFDLDIKGCEDKYSGTSAGNYRYAVTYVTKGGQVMNVYLNEIPKNFNLWNTDVVVSEGRVVVTGVNGDTANTWNILFSKYKGFIVGVSGLGALSCMLAFILTFIKMGALANNPSERSKFMATLFFTGLGAVCLGSVVMIFGFFWSAI